MWFENARRGGLVPAVLVVGIGACGGPSAEAKEPKPAGASALVESVLPQVDALYMDIHAHPELSGAERRTAATLSARVEALGFTVTRGIGGHGFVGVLRNGPGPVVALRAELDALPIEEKTGLPYASKVKAIGPDGTEVPVMHACGHDVHMAAMFGAASVLATERSRWSGTLLVVGQPAEETLSGAKAMIADGLFQRFPRPDAMLTVHDVASLPAGTVGLVSGAVHAGADWVDVTFFGRGGHGATPHRTVDPVVIAARAVTSFQTIVSRETDPMDPTVVTVGTIHGGTRFNVIPEEVKLQLSTRSFGPEARERVLSAISRISKAEAAAADAPQEPSVVVRESTPVMFNDADLTTRLRPVLRDAFGAARVVEPPPQTASEDFAYYGAERVPTVKMQIGAVDPVAMDRARATKTPLPATHSPLWAPDRERTLRAGVLAFTASALALMPRGR